MSHFSAGLRLTDLDDFITPSQACIKPIGDKERVEQEKIRNEKKSSQGIELRIEDDGSYIQIDREKGIEKKLTAAQITLNDCLACSGCITSAESVLIQQQNVDEWLTMMRKKEEGETIYLVIAIAPQSRASLAARYKLSNVQVMRRLNWFVHHIMKADCLLDTSFSREFALLESAMECMERYREEKNGVSRKLPMLASACPGWICYAEKTHGSFILPYISTTKSPQQIMGSYVKDYLARVRWQTTAEHVYHMTIMPCYDKKLEASRDDFYNDIYMTRDVDCVITTTEMDTLMQEKGYMLSTCPEMELDSLDVPIMKMEDGEELLYGTLGSGSGGYLEHVFRYMAKNLFHHDVDLIEYHITKNNDFKEIVLEIEGKMVLRCAAAYGFKNIQNLVRKIKLNKCEYHFVEIMACPSGCVNGGGQLRSSESGANSAKELLEQVEQKYLQVYPSIPGQNQLVQSLYNGWLEGLSSEKCRMLLHTQYKAVEKLVNPLAVKW